MPERNPERVGHPPASFRRSLHRAARAPLLRVLCGSGYDPTPRRVARMGKGLISPLERRQDRAHIPNNSSGGFTPPAAPASDLRPLLSVTAHMSQCTQRQEVKPSPQNKSTDPLGSRDTATNSSDALS